MTELMEKAAIKIIPNGLLKADTNISSDMGKVKDVQVGDKVIRQS